MRLYYISCSILVFLDSTVYLKVIFYSNKGMYNVALHLLTCIHIICQGWCTAVIRRALLVIEAVWYVREY